MSGSTSRMRLIDVLLMLLAYIVMRPFIPTGVLGVAGFFGWLLVEGLVYREPASPGW